MTANWIEEYDHRRHIAPDGRRTACFAPSTSLYFDTKGDVLACCHTHVAPLGNVRDRSLEDIWRGEAAQALRAALAAYDLPPACRFCSWQLSDGNLDEVYARNFDRFGLDTDPGDWPAQLEFSMSNRCNLQCVMCNGDFSSTIRSRRERRPPLPMPYGDEFFEQLPPFLPHLRQARFLGGEPFLIPEYQRIWDLIESSGTPVPCDLTTNGTVWNDRMAQTLEALPFSIAVSLDGMTATTVEAIRVGVRHADLMVNIERFAEYCERKGTPFGLTYCLMAPNWHEFPAFLRFADSLGANVYVNTVVWPPNLSLYQLAAEDLSKVITGLEAQDRVTSDDPRLRSEVDRLRRWAARQQEPDSPTFFSDWSPVPDWLGSRAVSSVLELADARRIVGAAADGTIGELVTNAEHVVTEASPTFLRVQGSELIGRHYGDALRRAAERLGSIELVADEAHHRNGVERRLIFDDGFDRVRAVAVTIVDTAADGTRSGTRTVAAIVDEFPLVSEPVRSSGPEQ